MNLSKEQSNIIEELVKAKIPITLKWDTDRIVYELDGFYKSGTVTLYPLEFKEDENTDIPYFSCEQRYDKREDIFSLQDIVFVNYQWWLDYKDRGYELDQRWVPLLLRFEYIQVETKTIKTYKWKV